GRTCSLVMLENEASYQRFGIVPADDALVVRQHSPTEVLAGVERDGEAELSNPRTAFLNWLDHLPQTPGVTITVARELRDIVQRELVRSAWR
ncbi:hypothetical protein, partial [Piscinibacter sp.]|uniref:hypothetical protein n=1 Tax=Piscinibacter sp. TaxID=1903157 RepID=UPI0037840D9F